MAGWAQTVIIGNVGRDAEMRYLANGTPVASFSVATTRRWKDRTTGESKEKTVWYRVSAWRALAETANQYIKKGMQIMVVGEMEEARAYLREDNTPAASLEMTASNFQFLGRREESGSDEFDTVDSANIPF